MKANTKDMLNISFSFYFSFFASIFHDLIKFGEIETFIAIFPKLCDLFFMILIYEANYLLVYFYHIDKTIKYFI